MEQSPEEQFVTKFIRNNYNNKLPVDITEAKDLIDQFNFGQYFKFKKPEWMITISLYRLCVTNNKMRMIELLMEKNYFVYEFHNELKSLCKSAIVKVYGNTGYDILEYLLRFVDDAEFIRSLLRYANRCYNKVGRRNDNIIELLEANLE